MNNFRSYKIFGSYKTRPAVHYIPSSSVPNAFGDTVPIGATSSGNLSMSEN